MMHRHIRALKHLHLRELAYPATACYTVLCAGGVLSSSRRPKRGGPVPASASSLRFHAYVRALCNSLVRYARAFGRRGVVPAHKWRTRRVIAGPVSVSPSHACLRLLEQVQF
ncbi:hypothetical protein L227DRAFT_161599 [Lentinus tigrinus ALCF2SS1-6]|uniref:Uncharacterized protein n=1 Tax=Lentinus tigrinus ALCF2SS1-6 TaxID=1328759 RepID=A0A5C2S8R5_9APHY|nr:hypothetical protein L227DRAFT_161599 [Lentinus tigrinus ALCF2SS1-6]